MSEPGRGLSVVAVERAALEALVAAVEGFWSDHKFAQTEDNPGWVRDRDAIRTAKKAMKAPARG